VGILEAIVYGVVQGVTEWLPISSTAHLRILPTVLGQPDPGAAFTAVIQLGTLLAVLIFFRKDLGSALGAWAKSLTNPEVRKTVEAKLGWGIFFGTIPIVVIGVLFQKHIKGELRSLWVVAFSLILMGLVMLAAEKFGRKDRSLDDVTVKDGLVVGAWQAIALIPGMSRSGSTISGALFSGFDRQTAARFSFLLSVPSVLAAGLKELIDERHNILGQNLVPVLVASLVSFVVGYWSIAFLIGFLQKRSTATFVAYRIALGLILIGLLMSGRLAPLDAAHATTPPTATHVSP
jgi:undecaprenyl-diphosphatase